MSQSFEKFHITQGAIIIKDNKCLVVQFTGQHAGYWDIPGGRIDVGEADKSESAFRREIKEELGVSDFDIIDLVAHDIWKNAVGDPVCALIYLVDNLDTYDIKLSHEHKAYKWIKEDEIKDEYLWPGATKMLKKGFKKYSELKNAK
ncbi:MAG: NUDIX hydrolase [Candidatus Kuenenbacteria bacterium]